MNDGMHRGQLSAKGVATGLLLAMGTLLFALRVLPPPVSEYASLWSYLTAFAEAALVGGLADWFAVTALFRHPLGLPIPHTAIIPSNRQRLADNIADFLEHNFLTREVLERELSARDFAALVGHYLASPAHCRWLVRHLWQQLLQQGGPLIRPAPVLGAMLKRFLELGRHDRLFDMLLTWAANSLAEHHASIYLKVSEKSPRWMPRRFNDEFFLRLIDGISELLDEMRAPDSKARQQFTDSLHDLAQRLVSGKEGAYSLALDGLPEDVFNGLFGGRHVARQLELELQALGQRLLTDEEARRWLNVALISAATDWLIGQRHAIVGLVRRVVLSWDEKSLVTRIELHVGRDLQFIRMNGTLVGGLVGLLLHGLKNL